MKNARSSALRLSLLAVCAVLLGTACGGPKTIVEVTPVGGEWRPRAIVLVPLGMVAPGTTATEITERSLDVARILMERTAIPVLGPFDLQWASRPEDTKVLIGETDIVQRAERLGLRLEDTVVLHYFITENSAVNVRDIEDERVRAAGKKPKIWRQHGFDVRVRIEISWLDPVRARKLGVALVEGQDDPNIEGAEGDPRPGLTALLARATGAALECWGERLGRPESRPLQGLRLYDDVRAILAFKLPEMPSFLEANAKLSEVERDAKILARYERNAPGADMRTTFRMQRAKPGVYVAAVPEGSPLKPGDVVMSVGPEFTLAAHQLDRALQLAGRGSRVPLKIERGGQPLELPFEVR